MPFWKRSDVSQQREGDSDSHAAPSGAGSDASPDTPWALAARQHEDRYLRLTAQVKNWRLFAFFALALAAVAVFGVIWIGSQSKFKPYMVEVDRRGQVLAIKVLQENAPKTAVPKEVYREMFDLIENLRTVTTDREANDSRIVDGFSRLRNAARTYVRSELRKAPPNEVGKGKTVQIVVKTAQPLTGKSWLVEWEELSRNLQGEPVGQELWRATITWTQETSDNESIFRRNPMGFYVDEMSWQKVITP